MLRYSLVFRNDYQGVTKKPTTKKTILAVGAMENTIKVDKPKKIWVIKGNI